VSDKADVFFLLAKYGLNQKFRGQYSKFKNSFLIAPFAF